MAGLLISNSDDDFQIKLIGYSPLKSATFSFSLPVSQESVETVSSLTRVYLPVPPEQTRWKAVARYFPSGDFTLTAGVSSQCECSIKPHALNDKRTTSGKIFFSTFILKLYLWDMPKVLILLGDVPIFLKEL
jgi:hypothetical protein